MPTMQDVESMLKVASQQGREQDILILKLISRTGLHEDELVGQHARPGLRVGDINFDRKTIQIVGIMRTPVTVDDETLAGIRAYISGKHLTTHDALIPMPKKELRKRISDLAVEANIIPPIKDPEKRFLWAPSDDDMDAIEMTALAMGRKHKLMNHVRMFRKAVRNYLLVRVMRMTGMRECESVGYETALHPGIRVKDINFERKVIKIYPKGIDSYADIIEKDLDDETLADLSAYIQQKNLQPEDRVFNVTTRQTQRIMKKLAVLAEHTIKRCLECREITAIEDPICPTCQSSNFESVKVAYAELFAPHRVRAHVATKVDDKTDINKAAAFLGDTEKSTRRYVFGSHLKRRRIFDEVFPQDKNEGQHQSDAAQRKDAQQEGGTP